ncbi:hypothetical protein C477_07131 [Haloterrigena salina JCM 13891]|uniref:Uncharacterized protein n=1 Tax=Haloterrigena salina JCM 13891 TaxID=1227488 RepID=M0CCT4_9EURY|nr:hypothetical protein C477_07131 [Haloterrigena salina JCM 13891]
MTYQPSRREWWATLHPAGRLAVIGFVTAVFWAGYLMIAYPIPPIAEFSTVVLLAVSSGVIFLLAWSGGFDS